MEQVHDQGAEIVKDFFADGIVEVAQARGGRDDVVLKTEEPAPTRPVLTSQEVGQPTPTKVQFPTQADNEEE